MATYLSNELAGTTTGLSTAPTQPSYRAPASVYHARLKRVRATVTLAGQLTTDTIVLANLPAGSTFAFGVIIAGVTLGTSTISIGTVGTPALYRAAAVQTAVDTPAFFGALGCGQLASEPGAEHQVVDLVVVHRHTTRRSAGAGTRTLPSRNCRNAARARLTRDITVPTGMCMTAATSA